MAKYRRITLIVIGLAVAGIALLAPWLVFFGLLSRLRIDQAGNPPLLDFANFLSAAMWVQAFIAWVTFIVIGFAASQIVLLYQQTKVQREQAEREAYRPLISPEMISAKRLINSPQIQEFLAELDKKIDDLQHSSAARYQETLDSARSKFEEIAKTMSWPLLHGTHASLDHVEMLIDEYNYLSKLIQDGKLKKEFTTDMGGANFNRIHQRILPLIRLRRCISGSYASHFVKFCEAG